MQPRNRQNWHSCSPEIGHLLPVCLRNDTCRADRINEPHEKFFFSILNYVCDIVVKRFTFAIYHLLMSAWIASHPSSSSPRWCQTYFWSDLRGDSRRPQSVLGERDPWCCDVGLHWARQAQDGHSHGRRLRSQTSRTYSVRLRRIDSRHYQLLQTVIEENCFLRPVLLWWWWWWW